MGDQATGNIGDPGTVQTLIQLEINLLNVKKSKTKPENLLTMHGPAVYRIHVRGRLDPKKSSRLAGMQISEICDSNGTPETILVGRLLDQAALSGLLESLYEMHLPVLSADCMGAEET